MRTDLFEEQARYEIEERGGYCGTDCRSGQLQRIRAALVVQTSSSQGYFPPNALITLRKLHAGQNVDS